MHTFVGDHRVSVEHAVSIFRAEIGIYPLDHIASESKRL
jgi:hypothetical protein